LVSVLVGVTRNPKVPALRPTDPLWSRKLAEMIPGALHGPIVGVNSVVSDPADKCRLRALTGAVAVDMGRLAASHGLAFAAVRVIVDPAHRALPPAALLVMAPSGSTDVSAMMWEILARPSQVSLLMRLAADAIAARTALIRLDVGIMSSELSQTDGRRRLCRPLNPAILQDRWPDGPSRQVFCT
jgi:hypothetical protein